jgi:hypothetical protein
MNQQIRRVVTVAGLTMALLLTLPASSRAADWREPASPAWVAGFMVRAWSWLEGALGPAPSHPAASAKTTTPPPVPVDPWGTGGQGSMIDPDGARR